MTDTDLLAKLAAPVVVTLYLTIEDAVVIRDALAMYRSPISENMATRDCLLELAQEKIDRAAALEDI